MRLLSTRVAALGQASSSLIRRQLTSDNAGSPGSRGKVHQAQVAGGSVALEQKVALNNGPSNFADIRNVGIIAHIDAGKTTTTERMLYYAGSIHQLGNVDDGNTTTDYMQQERARGITIQSAAVTFHWRGKKINLIDTPGHVDFTFEVERCLHVLDGAIAVLDASAGVEAQTVTVWQQANGYALPRIAYLNKMDKQGADVDACLRSMRERLRCRPLLVHLPLGRERDFEGVVDLPSMTVHRWPRSLAHLRGDGTVREMRQLALADGSDLWRAAHDSRVQLIDSLAELDEQLLAKALDAGDDGYAGLTADDVESALRRVVASSAGGRGVAGGGATAVPVLCGSSFRNCSVQPLLDAVVAYLPGPADGNRALYERLHQYYGDDLCAFAFKTIHDRHRGPMTFVRVYTGELRSGSTIYNATRHRSEKVTRICEVFASEHADIARATTGDVVAVTGLKETATGDTLVLSQSSMKKALAAAQRTGTASQEKAAAEEGDSDDDDGMEAAQQDDVSPILAGVPVPEPVFLCSVEAPTPSQQKLLDNALTCLLKEDPSLRMKVDDETGQTILMGMGELHMEVVKERITSEYGVEAYMGPLQISYRETVNAASEASAVIDKVIGDSKNHVALTMSVHPRPGAGPLKDVVLVKTKDNDLAAVRRTHLKAIVNGALAALSAGPILGFPVVDVEVHLHDFLLTERRTSLAIVAACASECVRKAVLAGQCSLLEPVVHVEISCQEQHLQPVLNDLARRRSTTHAVCRADSAVGGHEQSCQLSAEVPLAELIGYATMLRTITSGTGMFTMAISGYVTMSQEDTARVVRSG